MGRYNPNAPNVLGVEWPPLLPTAVGLSEEQEAGHTFLSASAETILTARFDLKNGSVPEVLCNPLVTVYRKGDELAYGEVTRTVVACSSLTATSGALGLQGGASTNVDGVSVAGDVKAVRFDAGDVAVARFATGGLFTGRRILHVNLLHVAIGSAAEPGLRPVIQVDHLRTGPQLSLAGNLLGRAADDAAREVGRFSLGEIDPFSNTDPNNQPERWPYTIAGVQDFAGAAHEIRLTFLTDGGVTVSSIADVYYLALEVVHCDENRVAVGGWVLSTDLTPPNVGPTAGWHAVTLRTPTGSAGWAKASAVEYAATVRNAPGGRGDDGGGNSANYGVPPDLAAIDGVTVFAPIEGRLMPLDADGLPVTAEAVSTVTPVLFFTAGPTISVDSHGYAGRSTTALGNVYTGSTLTQNIAMLSGGGTVDYPWVRFWCRTVGPTTADLVVTLGGTAVATLTVAAFDALDVVADGWRYVELPLVPASAITNAGTNKAAVFSTTAARGAHWQVLGASTFGEDGGSTTYGGSAAGGTSDGSSPSGADFAVSVATAAPVVAGVTATTAEQELVGIGDLVDGTVGCSVDSLGFVQVGWASSAIGAALDYYELQRMDTVDPTWRTIAQVSEVATNLVLNPLIGVAFAAPEWTIAGFGGTAPTVTDDPTEHLVGTASMKVAVTTNTGWRGERLALTGLTVGVTYTVSVWVKVSGTLTFNLYAEVTGDPQTSWVQTAADGWVRRSVTFVATTATPNIYLRMSTAAVNFWLNDVHVVAGSDVDGGFDDYEARVGVLSSYRVRAVRVDGTEGAWSATATATVPGASDPGLLLFTSNVDPTANLGYAEVGADATTQAFRFPEAEEVAFVRLYGRDGVTAVRSAERGGAAFERTLLVHGASIPTVTADRAFTGLRDLAWADLPYVCVRDGQGNRWFSNVLVPEGSVRLGRVQLVRVAVREVTFDPYPVT